MSLPASIPPRRRFLLGLAAFGAALGGAAAMPGARAAAPITRAIPASGERLPVIGMGTWITFDVGNFPDARARRAEILGHFFSRGGALVDSSPMYGEAQSVLGYCLRRLENDASLFAATKVWTPGPAAGVAQMEESRRLWGIPRLDLMQIHNLVDWETHIETLREWKAAGRIRYIGITTSHGRRHAEFERVMALDDVDFVQFTYNIIDREAERRLLPLAAELGRAVIINRPFRGGSLFDHVRNRPLPAWAAEFDCENWAQYFLKFIVSDPAVTCAIPATSQLEHMRENMGALFGRLPAPDLRARMVRHFQTL